MSQAIEVLVAGIKLNINIEDNPEQVLAAAAMVQQQFDALKKSGTIIDTSKIMALIALNIADDLISQRKSNPASMENLISSLDQAVAQAQGLANVSLR